MADEDLVKRFVAKYKRDSIVPRILHGNVIEGLASELESLLKEFEYEISLREGKSNLDNVEPTALDRSTHSNFPASDETPTYPDVRESTSFRDTPIPKSNVAYGDIEYDMYKFYIGRGTGAKPVSVNRTSNPGIQLEHMLQHIGEPFTQAQIAGRTSSNEKKVYSFMKPLIALVNNRSETHEIVKEQYLGRLVTYTMKERTPVGR